MAGIVDSRIRIWTLVAEVVSPEDPGPAERLNSGAWVADMHDAVAWLGDLAERFRPALEAVSDTSAIAPAAFRSPSSDSDSIAVLERVGLFPMIESLLVQLAAEKRAWAGGDDEHAKTLRLAQHDQLNKKMVPAVQRWCYDSLNQQDSPALAAFVKVLAIVLSMETGRDYERALGGDDFRISSDII